MEDIAIYLTTNYDKLERNRYEKEKKYLSDMLKDYVKLYQMHQTYDILNS